MVRIVTRSGEDGLDLTGHYASGQNKAGFKFIIFEVHF